MARKKAIAVVDESEFEDVPRCPDCGNDNLYTEEQSESEFINGRNKRVKHITYFCLNESCGQTWTETVDQ